MNYLPNQKKLLILLLSIVIILTSCENENSERDAPQFELTDLNGNIVKLEDFAGEKVYIKFWTSWCSICLAGLEELNKLANEDNDFTVLSIVHPNYKGEKPTDSFISWFQSLEFESISVLLDEKGDWTERYRVMAYPSAFYINNQKIIKSTVGHESNEKIKQTMNKTK